MANKDDRNEKQEHIEQIRDIILGPQRLEFENQLRTLETSVTDLRSDIQKQQKVVSAKFSTDLTAAVQLVEQQLQSLRTIQTENHDALRGHLAQLDHKFSQAIETANQNLTESSSSSDKKLDEINEKLKLEIGNLKTQLYRDLEERILALRENHLPREILSEMLFELGTKVKNVTVLTESEKLAQKNNHARR